jgi:SPX domain protein involved in polyphosphate accumulation
LSKPKYKEKLRLRCYINEAKDDDLVFLEVKKKFRGVVNKRRVILPLIDIEKYLETGKRPENITSHQSQIFDEIDYIIQREAVKPAVYLSYKRIAMFAKEDPSIRLTIDKNIITRTQNLSLREKRYGDELLPNGFYLMEIKVNGVFPLWLAHILTDLKIYPTSFSKYGQFHLNRIKETFLDE